MLGNYLQINRKKLPLFVMFLLLGFFSYYLKFFSISSVVQRLPHTHYPFVLATMGLSSFFAVKNAAIIFEKLKNKSVFLILTILGLFSYPKMFTFLPNDIVYAYFLFIISLVGSAFLQTYFVASVLKRNSIEEPLLSTKILLLEEIGTLCSAFITLKYGFGFYSIPLMLILSIIILSMPKSEFKEKSLNGEISSLYPFGEILVNFFIIFMICKVFFAYLFLESLKGAESSGNEFLKIFASFSSFEALATIGFLLLRSSGQLNLSWPKAFKSYFLLIFIMMITLILTKSFYFALIACGFSKVWQKVLLKDSAQNIFHSLPLKVRIFYWIKCEKESHLYGYMTLFIISAILIYFDLSKVIIPLLMIIFACIGALFLKKLIETITQFHVANMARSGPRDAYISCLALLVLNAEEHRIALYAILSKTEDKRLKKAIIHVVGKIKSTDSLKKLTDYYRLSGENEEIQLAIVRSLINFKSHDVDVFLLDSLTDIINKQTSLGEIRRTLFLKITSRLKDIAIPTILKLIRESQDHRVIANALIVLGEIAVERKDNEAFETLVPYMDKRYSRRIRSNAILYLFKVKKYKKMAYGVFEEFLTSKEVDDQSAAAFLAGELKLRGITPFIWENSVNENHSNPTLLFSLLKLEFSDIEKLILDFIFQADREKALLAMNQFSSIDNLKNRYKVYRELLKRSRKEIFKFIDLMKKSGRDFDEDLRLLEEELEKMSTEEVLA